MIMEIRMNEDKIKWNQNWNKNNMERNYCTSCKKPSLVITAWHSSVCTLCGIEKKEDYDTC